jgi:hypothetical protein
MRFLLRLKHWQLFLLIVLPAYFISNSLIGRIIDCVWMVFFIGWIYVIGISMYTLVQNKDKFNINYFKFSCLFVSVAFAAIIIIYGGYSIDQSFYQRDSGLILLLISFHAYLIWSLLHIFYFAAKALVSVTEGDVVRFSEFYRTFLAFCFYPIGLWFIQPAVQKILGVL